MPKMRERLIKSFTYDLTQGLFEEKFKLKFGEYEGTVFDKVIENVANLKMGYPIHLIGTKKEYLAIPIRFSERKISVIPLTGAQEPSRGLRRNGYLHLMFRWWKGSMNPVPIRDLPLYVSWPYKTHYFERLLDGTLKLPLYHIPKGV